MRFNSIAITNMRLIGNVTKKQYQLYQGAFAHACFPDDDRQTARMEVMRKVSQHFPFAAGISIMQMRNADTQVPFQMYWIPLPF